MKIIIKQKRYDTDTAKECGQWENMQDRSNLDWYSETMYQKRSGEFFLHGVGNANSKYSRCVGNNSWRGLEKVIPLDYEAARIWADEHLDEKQYEEIFGKTDEPDRKVVLTFSLPVSVSKKLKLLASQRGKPMSEVLADLVNEQ